MFRHRLFASSIKLKIKQFHIVVVRKLQRNVQKKCATRAKLLFCLLNLLLLLLLLLFVCVVFWRSRCPCVVGSSSPYLSGTRRGDGCIFFLLTRLPTSLHASPRQKKERLIAGLSNRWHVFIPCLDSGKYRGFGQEMSKERLCLKKM